MHVTVSYLAGELNVRAGTTALKLRLLDQGSNNYTQGVDISQIILSAYHLARKSGNFGLKSNGKVVLQKFRLEIVEYLQRNPSLSIRNRTAEISLPFAKLSSFQSLISGFQTIMGNQSANGKRHFVRLVC